MGAKIGAEMAYAPSTIPSLLDIRTTTLPRAGAQEEVKVKRKPFVPGAQRREGVS